MSNQYEEMKQASEAMETPEAKEVKDIANLFEENLIKEERKARVPEVIFKEHYVDFFKNYNKDTKPTEADSTTYARWLTIAGSEFNEVDIINESGDVIFTVPPLLTKPTVDFKATRAIKVDDTAYDATNRYNRTPAESSNYMTSKVTKMMSGAISIDTTHDVHAWERILNRYKNPEVEEQKKLEEKKKKIPTIVKEDLGLNYD